ncbi:MAG: type IV pilus secretin PilQ [Thermodesulfobacteriota bacterium]
MKPSPMLKMISLVVFLIFANGCATKNTLVQTGQPPDTSGQSVKASLIQRISFTEEENYTRIHIEGTDTIAPPFYKLMSDPLRIAIDVPNIDLSQVKEPIKINNGTIGDVIATQYDDKGRIEIGLAQMTNYNISKEDKNLIIDIEKVKKVAEAEVKEVQKEETIKEETVKEKETEAIPVESKKEEPPSAQPVVATPAPETVKKAKEIVNFSLEEKKDFIVFNIIADGKLENYNSFKLDSPTRLVLDLWEVNTRYPKKSIKIKNPFLKEVRIGHHPDKLRLVFDSLKPQLPPYQINRIDDKLIVSIGNVPQPSEPQILLEEKPKKGISTPALAKAPSAKVKTSILREINFKQMDNKSRVMVAFTEEPKFESSMISTNVIAVDIKNAFAPKHLQRGLDTSEFESAVNYIQIQNIKTGKTNDVRLLIKLREEMPFEATQEGKVLFIDIERPKKIEAKIEVPPVPKKEEVVVEAKKEEVKEVIKEEEKPKTELKKEEKVLPPVEEKPIPQPPVTKKVEEVKKVPEEGLPEKAYTGKRLSLDFKDADIKNILRLIAEVSNLNIIAGDDVTGKITMRLVDVPWDQALDVILQARSLGMSRVGNVVRVAPLDTLKREIQAELEARRAKERLEDLVTELIPINYATGKEIMPQVKSVLSDRGDVKVDERTNILIVKDIPRNIAGVKNLVKSLDTKTPQVLIEARIVEASLTFQTELGVKWGFEIGGGKATAGGGISATTLGTATREVINLPAVARAGVAGTSGTVGIIEFLFSRGTIQQLDLAISAHENKGDVKIISSPKIATLDNKEASIEQGLRIPYRKLTTEGTVTTDFIDANLKLTVTPHVTNDGNIKMSIKAKKDAPDTSITVDGVPSIDKKEAITEVLVKDNGVVVIAGVYSIEKSDGTEGVPLFSKIPLLGWLFKREAKEDKRKDLLIFISPKIIKDQV